MKAKAELAQLRTRWAALAPRERGMLGLAVGLVALALLWWIALAPAIKTLAGAREEHAKLDAQLLKMTTLQAQAKTLQALPRANRAEAVKALEDGVRANLGAAAQLQQQGGSEGVNLQLRGVPADALAQWLAQARGNARAVPREVHLTRSASAEPAPADGAKARWDGTLVMSLPGAR